MLENLLLWARSQTNNMEFSRQNNSINEIILENFELLKYNLQDKQINFKFKNSENINANFDKNMISTVVRNLFSNAIKFTPYGGTIEIGMTIEPTDGLQPSGAYTSIYIQDTGVGIPEYHLEKLFSIDSTVTTVGTNKEKGTGLGLILCKEFVEKHGGKIWVESKFGKVSKFSFTIPKST